jgi:hypothetical protein
MTSVLPAADSNGYWTATLPGGMTVRDITMITRQQPLTIDTSEMSPRWVFFRPLVHSPD